MDPATHSRLLGVIAGMIIIVIFLIIMEGHSGDS